MADFELNGRTFEVDCPGHPVNEGDINSLEATIEMSFPVQLRSYYLRWNGGLPCPTDIPMESGIWTRLKWQSWTPAAQVGSAAPLQPFFKINSSPDTDLLRVFHDFKERIPGGLMPFAPDPGGSLFLIGTDEHNRGRIYFWERGFEADIGAGEKPGYANIADVADSFTDFLLLLRGEPKDGEELDDYVKRVWPD